jgi:hypothetical protein
MSLKGTQNDDKELMEEALQEFQGRARSKFIDGIFEHNPNGDKGICKMSFEDRIKNAKEEVIDLWFYLISLENVSKEDQEGRGA